MDTSTTTTTDLAMTDISLHPRTSPPPNSKTKTAKITWNEGLAFTFCCISVVLLTAVTSMTDWVVAEGWKEGLFMQCVSVGAATPLPFDMPEDVGCGKLRSASYIHGVAALVIIGLVFDLFGTFLTGLGLRSTNPDKKQKYYRVAIAAIIIALISLLIAAIVYPVMFSQDLANESPNDGGVIKPQLHKGSIDFDDDGIIDIVDEDDDNDGIPDDEDYDDDNDGIQDYLDDDDDNDGVPDVEEGEDDYSGDGYLDTDDEDDDGDDIPDLIIDNEDDDDDNDGIPDEEYADDDDDNDGIPDEEYADDDNYGIMDDVDDDDDHDVIFEEEEHKGNDRTYTFGFGYGVTWGCIILKFASAVLLIWHRKSEESFNKEISVEKEDNGEA